MEDPTPREVARVRVIFGDTDQMGMVYYATYLRFFEVGRNEYLRQVGASYRAFEEEHGLRLPVVELHTHYHASARYDDEVVIATAVAPRGAASVRFVYELSRAADGARLVSGWTVHACINREGRVVRIPGKMREAVGIAGSGA
jgi:acyl-CoA thioester hydrolase